MYTRSQFKQLFCELLGDIISDAINLSHTCHPFIYHQHKEEWRFCSRAEPFILLSHISTGAAPLYVKGENNSRHISSNFFLLAWSGFLLDLWMMTKVTHDTWNGKLLWAGRIRQALANDHRDAHGENTSRGLHVLALTAYAYIHALVMSVVIARTYWRSGS